MVVRKDIARRFLRGRRAIKPVRAEAVFYRLEVTLLSVLWMPQQLLAQCDFVRFIDQFFIRFFLQNSLFFYSTTYGCIPVYPPKKFTLEWKGARAEMRSFRALV